MNPASTTAAISSGMSHLNFYGSEGFLKSNVSKQLLGAGWREVQFLFVRDHCKRRTVLQEARRRCSARQKVRCTEGGHPQRRLPG